MAATRFTALVAGVMSAGFGSSTPSAPRSLRPRRPCWHGRPGGPSDERGPSTWSTKPGDAARMLPTQPDPVRRGRAN